MKRNGKQLSALNRIVINACERRIKSRDGREMSVIEAIVNQDVPAALQGDNQAKKRLWADYERASDRRAELDAADREWLLGRQRRGFELFETAERLGLPPPDFLPHPTHIHLTDDGIIFTGPITAEDRAWWESIKAAMRWAMETLAAARWLDRAFSDERSRHFLRKIRALVERIRRKIPPGWDWKEKIYSLGSSAEELARYQEEVERRLERENPEIIRKIDEEVASWFPRASLRKKTSKGLAEPMRDSQSARPARH